MQISHGLDAKNESEDLLQIPDLFVSPKSSEEEYSSGAGTSGAEPSYAEPSYAEPSISKPFSSLAEKNAFPHQYLPSTLYERHVGKKSKLRRHCEVCGLLLSTDFDSRMHMIMVHKQVAAMEKKIVPENVVN